MESFDDHFSKELNSSKLHVGQRRVAELMRENMSGSSLIKKRLEYFSSTDNIEGE